MEADTLSALLTQAGLALVVVTGLAAVLGWLVAGRVLRPIRAISSTARRLSAEDITERVPVTVPADELYVLAGTVNEMLDRIQRGVVERDRILDSQRLFTANAAHELRTPLTTARTAIDVTLDGDPSRAELLAMAGDVRAAVEHVQRVLDGLLLLARSQAGIGAREPADLAVASTSPSNSRHTAVRRALLCRPPGASHSSVQYSSQLIQLDRPRQRSYRHPRTAVSVALAASSHRCPSGCCGDGAGVGTSVRMAQVSVVSDRVARQRPSEVDRRLGARSIRRALAKIGARPL